jgi:hypothetical protein
MLKIIDNFLNEDVINVLEKHFLQIPHYFGHSSIIPKKGEDETKHDRFYMTELNFNNPLVDIVGTKIRSTVDFPLKYLRVYINVQHTNMNGEFHSDDGQVTFLLMSSRTLNPGSGTFEIKLNNNDNEIHSVNFVKNRLIMFDASWQHRGLAPLEIGIPRITLAFKTEIIKNAI